MKVKSLAAATIVAASLAVLSAAQAANQVLIADAAGGPGTFASLHDAVAAAGDGDIVLVRPGTYDDVGPATIAGKSLSVIADAPPGSDPPVVSNSMRIDSIGAAQRVVIRGLDVRSFFNGFTGGIVIEDCAGAVFLEDVSFTPSSAAVAPGMYAARVVNSPRVVLSRCDFTGPAGNAFITSSLVGGDGLEIVASHVALYEGSITGGDGFSPPTPASNPSSAGAAGIELVSGSLAVVGATVRGGDGGNGSSWFLGCIASSNGGAGIVAGGLTRLIGANVAGGAPGIDVSGCPQVGVSGPATVLAGGSIHTLNDPVRSLTMTSPGFDGQSITTTIVGQPGENVVLLFSTAAGGAYLPSLKGALLPGDPLGAIGLGAIPPSGVLQFQSAIDAGPLGPGMGADLMLQILVAGAAGTGLLGSPTVLTVVK